MIDTTLRNIIKEEFPTLNVYVGSMPQTVKKIAVSIRDVTSDRDKLFKVYRPIVQFTILGDDYIAVKDIAIKMQDFLEGYMGGKIDNITITNHSNFRLENNEYRILDCLVSYRNSL